MWRALIRMAKSQPLFDWRQACKAVNFELFQQRFLDPAEGEAWNLICPNRKKCSIADCGIREVRTIGGRLVAYCPHNPAETRLPLRDCDVENKCLSYKRMHNALCKTLNLEYRGIDLDNGLFWELGAIRHGVGRNMPVYISYYIDRQSLREKLKIMLAKGEKSFVVLAADRNIFPREMVTVLDDSGACTVFLNEAVAINEDTSFTARPETLEVFSRFAGKKTTPTLEIFETSSTTRWSDIHIAKITSDKVSIWLTGGTHAPFSCQRMGMENTTKHEPSLAFQKLLEFLEAPNGRIMLPVKGGKENNDLRKRVLEIRQTLKRFFPKVDGDPICLLKTEGCYMVNFQRGSASEE